MALHDAQKVLLEHLHDHVRDEDRICRRLSLSDVHLIEQEGSVCLCVVSRTKAGVMSSRDFTTQISLVHTGKWYTSVYVYIVTVHSHVEYFKTLFFIKEPKCTYNLEFRIGPKYRSLCSCCPWYLCSTSVSYSVCTLFLTYLYIF